MELAVINLENKNTGNIEISDDVFARNVRVDILHRVVEWQRAKKRKGCHKTKTISEVSGTTKKPYKQKGTGNARHGSLRSNIFRGGAVVFGPVVRSHEIKLPKKVRKLGLKMALSQKMSEGKLIIIDSMKSDTSKTKYFKTCFENMGIKSSLIVDDNEFDNNFLNGVSNLQGMDVILQEGLNVYDILRHEHLVISKEAVKLLEERLRNE